jgi:hypothetical protein
MTMNMTIDRDDEETIFQSGQCPSMMDSEMNALLHSSHRQWAEEWEREQQERDERVVQQFLRSKLKKKEPALMV